jgi:hypothetical protein
MQAPTHILAGVAIQKAFEGKKPRALALAAMAVLAFLSHGVLDKLARVTYHRPDADFHNPIWVGFHVLVVIVTIIFLVLWWKPYKWGIIFASLPDVDWVFIHGQELLHIKIPFYRQPHLHHLLGLLVDHVPPFTYMDKLPNYRLQPWACVWEILLMAIFILLIRWMNRGTGLQDKIV